MPQSLSNILVHLVFSTKDRHPFLTPEIRSNLFPYLGGITREIGCTLLQAGGVEDHVHLLFVLSRTMTLAKAVEEIKTGSSRWMKTKGNAFREFAWQSGYAAFSVSPSDKESVRRYILDQSSHHGRLSFQDELRRLLAEAGIDFDERYLWD